MKAPCIVFYRFKDNKNWSELSKANSYDEAKEKANKFKKEFGRKLLEFKIVLDDHYLALKSILKSTLNFLIILQTILFLAKYVKAVP